MRKSKARMMIAAAALGLAASMSSFALAQTATPTFKLAIVTFTSGPAAESFGTPAWQAAQTVVNALNAGEVPAPYDKPGFGRMKVELSVIDESGGTTKQVQELRNAYERDGVDAVIAYVSSTNCLAAAPVAEELKKLLILFECGTPRIFEDAKYRYVFRNTAHATMDNVALARYIIKRKIKAEDVAAINQDYAFGRDNWKDFIQSLQKLNPSSKVKAELWPKFGAGQYGTEISALLQANPQIIHSSMWGGDLQAFILQAAPRGLFKGRHAAIVVGEHMMQPLREKLPEGVMLGARGANGPFARPSKLNDWLVAAHTKAYPGSKPGQAQYRMSQEILGLKAAVEKAMTANGGKRPTTEQIVDALTGLEWEAPSGRIRMALGDGHQAIQEAAIGMTKWDPIKKEVTVVDVEWFAAECVNPPPGMRSEEWIAQGFPGAKCN